MDRCYSIGFMVTGFPLFPQTGLAAPHRTYYRGYRPYHLASTECAWALLEKLSFTIIHRTRY